MKRLSTVVMAVLVSLCMAGAASAQVIVSQTPDQFSGYYSDERLGGAQALAEDFTLLGAETIYQIRLWGGYYTNDIPFADSFTVIFHTDSAGVPGGVVSTESGVPVARTATGMSFVGITEYEYVLTLANPVTIGPGTYWVEVYNNSTGQTDEFLWETGNQDVVFGAPGLGVSTTAPGSLWNYVSNIDLSFELINQPPAAAVVPTMNEWGAIIFIAIAGIASVVIIRRHRLTAV